MYKIINGNDLPYDCPTLSLIDIHSKGVDSSYMTKRAAVMTDTISKIRPEKGWSYLHVVAMGSGEYYGSNRNGDWFNENTQTYTFPEPINDREISLGGGLKEYYGTFRTNANVYREHANKDVTKRRGTVEDSAYNNPMHRIELVTRVSNEICGKELQKIANGEQVMYSMACIVPYDICSICGNKAKTPSEYCTHVTTMINRILRSGHKVVMINDKPNFFDISFVLVPADRIAGTLSKIASYREDPSKIAAPFEVFLRSPDSHVATKAATLSKLAEIEKEISSNIPGIIGANGLQNCLPPQNLPDDFMSELGRHDQKDSLGSLNNARVLLSLPDYLKLIMGDNFGAVKEDIPYAQNSLPTVFNDLKNSPVLDEVLGNDEFDSLLDGGGCGVGIPRDIVSGYSLGSEPVMNRSIRIVITPGSTKNASQGRHNLISKRGSYLAKEYARYAISFASRGSSLERKLLVANNRI